MSLTAIEKLLKDTMGLNAASIGSSAIERAVQQRMRELSLVRPDDYLLRVRSSLFEVQQLINEVVIPETWFFRDRQPFIALANYAIKKLKDSSHNGPLRILSAPSSTGEEPYSIVMALLDAGLKANDFQIEAIDISEPNLQRAQLGQYRDNSFRGEDLRFRDKYFLRNDQGYLLQPQVRRLVVFQHANLLATDFSTGRARYDIVFCRNLLIYFDRATQARALQVLERLLRPDGILFLGHAEAGVVSGRDFTGLDHPCSFAFMRGVKSTTADTLGSNPFKTTPPRRLKKFVVQNSTPKPFAAAIPPAPDKPPQEYDIDTVIASATQLANEGHMVEAANVCENYLRQHGPVAQAFYLLAIVREAVGDPAEAEVLLRKALYLDPNHYEALSQLALLLDKRGDTSNAELMRLRAKRCHGRLQNEAASRADSP